MAEITISWDDFTEAKQKEIKQALTAVGQWEGFVADGMVSGDPFLGINVKPAQGPDSITTTLEKVIRGLSNSLDDCQCPACVARRASEAGDNPFKDMEDLLNKPLGGI